MQNLVQEIKSARQQLVNTEMNLKFASNEDVDIAIHEHDAARAKYNFLLRKAKEEGVKSNEIEIAGFAKRR